MALFTDRRQDIVAEVAAKIDSLKWIKICGIGNVGVGKTCLIKFFCENKYTPGYQATVGVDYGFKIHSANDEELRVHLWDLSGSDDYFDVRSELYVKTDGVFITFDLTNQSSFDNLSYWIDEINKFCSPRPSIVLVGCKSDLKDKRVVLREKAEDWAKRHRIEYFEVSAATGDNVEKMYSRLLTMIGRKS